MVMTILEARVAEGQVSLLEQAFRDASSELPPGLVESFLVRDEADPSLHRIVTLWRDRAALDAMRASGATPKGVQIFRAAGAAPVVSIMDVRIHTRR
jgi:quinol monooxygenase YgiN